MAKHHSQTGFLASFAALTLCQLSPYPRCFVVGRGLRLYTVTVSAVKDVLVEQRRAYCLTIRGRNYRAYLPKLGEIWHKPVVYLDDAEALVRRVVEIANQTAAPRK